MEFQSLSTYVSKFVTDLWGNRVKREDVVVPDGAFLFGSKIYRRPRPVVSNEKETD